MAKPDSRRGAGTERRPVGDSNMSGNSYGRRVFGWRIAGAGLLCAAALAAGGCAGLNRNADPGAAASARPPEVQAAEALYEAGEYREALLRCVELTRRDPDMPGLIDLRNRSIAALLDQRAQRVVEREEETGKQMALEAREKGFVPSTYGLERFESGDEQSFAEQDSPLYDLLQRKVSIHLEGANVAEFIRTLSADESINMIADRNLASNKSIHIDVTAAPLREVLDFMSRNYEVEFYLGESIIWVTAARQPGAGGPMQTRMFNLKRGLQLHGSGWSPKDEKPTSNVGVLSARATVLADGITYIQEIVEKFVPVVDGSQFHIDLNTHTVFARNTPDNLKLIGEILEQLDRSPKQVLIEARFIEISQSNLRELGLEWTLNSPYAVTKKGVVEDGVLTRQPETVIQEGGSLTFNPYTSDDSGAFPLGPQGSFGLLRDGNPATASQGLNLTYQGVLTEPMFQAVLHAIDISGDGKILSVPRVTTVNNNPAKLRDGDDLLYYREFQAQAFHLLDDDNKKYTVTALIPKGTPDLAELGITLVAVPSVGADNRTISLLLTPAISSLDRFVSYQEDSAVTNRANRIQQVVVKLPVITRREVQTKVVVESGETVVLGGLIRTVRQETVHKVPILGSLPLIGNLFKRLDVTEENKNLLIFVTATVINERGESVLPRRNPPGA
jgi:type IV pilus assembly protein PilQ